MIIKQYLIFKKREICVYLIYDFTQELVELNRGKILC